MKIGFKTNQEMDGRRKSRTNQETGWSSTLLRNAMLRMFLEFDSFIFWTRFQTAFRIRVTKKTQDALEPVSQRFLEIPFCVPRYLHTSPDPHWNQENQLNPKNQLKPKRRAIILRLPEPLVDRLDTVVSDLEMPSRSYYLRRSIERALDFSETREIPLFNDLNALGNPPR